MKRQVTIPNVNGGANAEPMTCATCLDRGPANRYHPYEFWVLIKAGQNPREFLRRALEHGVRLR